MSIKNQFINGVFWSSLSQFSVMGMEFAFGIILARLLSPTEFGLIGMITIFISIGQIFINSGFSQALVRKSDCTDQDYSTVFVFNLVAGLVLFFTIYFIAPFVSEFYAEPQLTWLLRILSFSLIISAFTIIQRTTVIKRLDFKLQAKISIISTIISGILALVCAYQGMGVWSLVVKVLSREFIFSVLIWFWNSWKPSLTFVKASFDDLFGFGSKLLVSGIIGTIFSNINYIIIGKYFSADALGFYTRAEMFKSLPSENISGIVTSVAYPALAKVQDDPVKLKYGFQKVLTSTAFVVFILMAGMIAVAEPMIITLIGEKWRPSIYYLQLLSILGMLHPVNSINVNMLNVIGRSDLYMKLQFIMQFLSIPAAIIGVFYGIDVLIYAILLNGFIGYFVFGYTAGKLTDYSIKEQLTDLIPLLILSIVMGILVFFFGYILPFDYLGKLVTQILFGATIIFVTSELVKPSAYLMLKEILIQKLKVKND